MPDIKKQRAENFVAEASILAIANFAIKIISIVYKIPLRNILGGSYGIFLAAYSIYTMLFMVSTSGLPAAVSKMISSSQKQKRHWEVKKIFRLSIMIFGVVGLAASLFMFFGAQSIAQWSKHPDSVLALKVISPSLFFICITATFRGYFQGKSNMVPTAVSQFIEAFLKMALGLTATVIAVKSGASPAVQAAYAISGVSAGIFFGMIFLIIYKKVSKKEIRHIHNHNSDSGQVLVKRLLNIAFPATITASALYFSQFADTIIINNVLVWRGFSMETAEALFTAYTGDAASISDILPSTLVFPIAVSLLPAIAGAVAVKNLADTKRYIYSSIRISGIIALPCSFCLFALARPAIQLLYHPTTVIDMGEGVMKNSIDISAPALGILALGIFFISLLSTTNAIHQACGKPMYPVIAICIGVVVLLILETLLTALRPINIWGAAIASVMCYVAAMLLNLRFLRKSQKLRLPMVKMFKKPFVCAALSGLFCAASYRLLKFLWELVVGSDGEGRVASFVILMITAVGAVLIYVYSMLVCKGIRKNEIKMLPKGDKLCDYFIRKGLLR